MVFLHVYNWSRVNINQHIVDCQGQKKDIQIHRYLLPHDLLGLQLFDAVQLSLSLSPSFFELALITRQKSMVSG